MKKLIILFNFIKPLSFTVLCAISYTIIFTNKKWSFNKEAIISFLPLVQNHRLE